MQGRIAGVLSSKPSNNESFVEVSNANKRTMSVCSAIVLLFAHFTVNDWLTLAIYTLQRRGFFILLYARSNHVRVLYNGTTKALYDVDELDCLDSFFC